MDSFCPGIFLPYGKIRFHIDPLYTVESDNIKLSG